MTTAVVTGFPGFLGSALVPRLRRRFDHVRCLVEPARQERAQQELQVSTVERNAVHLHAADLTEPGLGIDQATLATLSSEATELFHLAAAYDLGVDRDTAEAVNVRGTERLCSMVTDWTGLERFHHVSTCYVSGRFTGEFTAADLEVGQRFNNHYEASKFRAERVVRRQIEENSLTVYRPAIVVGDSRTGYIESYNGPYYLLRWLLRCGTIAPVPWIPGMADAELNVVPRDVVVASIDSLAAMDVTAGETYQLCDPNPPTVQEGLALFATEVGTRTIPIPTTRRLARAVLSRPTVRSHVQIEPNIIEYLTHPTRYTSGKSASLLSQAGIEIPPLESYVGQLVDFARDTISPSPDQAPERRSSPPASI